jgi:hypothetical protein
MLVLCVRPRSKLSADTISNPVVRVVEGSLTDEEALKGAMTGMDTVVSFLGARLLPSAFIWRTKTTPIALPSDDSTRRETNLGLVNTILSCQFRVEVLDVLATRFHAAYLCATRECRDGSHFEERYSSVGPRLDHFSAYGI